MGKRKALIIGVSGQDGAYLAKFLLEKGYTVFGAIRRSSTLNLPRLTQLGIDKEIILHSLDITDLASVMGVVASIEPNEIYNLSGQSAPLTSFSQPILTAETSALGTLRVIEAMRLMGILAKFYQASSSEIFGDAQTGGLNEDADFRPRSPYGLAKLYAHWIVKNYREAYDLHASSGILFSHESPLRGMDFVTRKITATLAQIACGGQQMLMLGNLDNARDWGFAGDYVEAMWLMLQQHDADDYIIASGVAHKGRDFVTLAAAVMGIDIVFEGEGLETRGIDKKSGRQLVGVSADFYRPSEPDPLVGDASKARRILCWQPKIDFEKLVTMMAESDLERARNGQVWY